MPWSNSSFASRGSTPRRSKVVAACLVVNRPPGAPPSYQEDSCDQARHAETGPFMPRFRDDQARRRRPRPRLQIARPGRRDGLSGRSSPSRPASPDRWSCTSTRPTTPPAARRRRASSTRTSRHSQRSEPSSSGSHPDGAEKHQQVQVEVRARAKAPLGPRARRDDRLTALTATKTLYGKQTVGVIRSTFLIGANGKIRRAWYSVRADGHAAKVLAEAAT